MMKNITIIVGILCFITTSCVQKSYKQTINFQLDVKGIKNIKTVGIRGIDKPLNWDYDYEMKLGKDSIYTATISGVTGYKFTEVKFTINGDYELKDQPNRRVVFNNSGITIYDAIFDRVQ